jgi:hypothetical protein
MKQKTKIVVNIYSYNLKSSNMYDLWVIKRMHIWLLLLTVQYTDVPLQPVRLQYNTASQTVSQGI